MPPNALYDVFCVLHAAGDILGRAAHIQAQKASRQAAAATRNTRPAAYDAPPESPNVVDAMVSNHAPPLDPVSTPRTSRLYMDEAPASANAPGSSSVLLSFTSPQAGPTEFTPPLSSHLPLSLSPLYNLPTPSTFRPSPSQFNPTAPQSASTLTEPLVPLLDEAIDEAPEVPIKLTPSRVPSSRIGRLFHYGSLAAGLSAGAATEFLRRSTSSSQNQGSLLMSEGNVNRLVDKLSKMRGAALKLGQFMSIQDTNVLPEQLETVLRQVQSSAHYMPNWQMEQVMSAEFGPDWRTLFTDFDPIPFASASIGQVHYATLAPSVAPDTPYRSVCVKIQFPNVASSIRSDLRNLSLLLTGSRLLPKGLFLDKTLEAMEEELGDECDYTKEAEAARKFKKYLEGDERFEVMGVVDELCTSRVLVMQRMEGVPIVKAVKWSQAKRDEIGANILALCLRELFDFRFMQTDPNWSNFLYNRATNKVELIDFGASRAYSKTFMDDWYNLLTSAITGDEAGCEKWSLKLGYLTGEENEVMLRAHIRSLTLLGYPFADSTRQPYAFSHPNAPSTVALSSGEDPAINITQEIRALIPTMLANRLTPPPRETYSLNRKLSGAFLLCGRLGARVDCREVWRRETGGYKLGGLDEVD